MKGKRKNIGNNLHFLRKKSALGSASVVNEAATAVEF